jgi:hypothetical protein
MPNSNESERFYARILFSYADQGEKEGRVISYIYNREALDALYPIKKQTYDNSQFIEVGDIIELEGKKCIVKSINFKLEDHINEMGHGYGVNLYSPTDPTDFNCQIGVFVDWVE